MDFVNILLFCLMSCVLGAVLMLLIQYYAFVRYLNVPEQSEEQKLYNEKYFLPDSVLASIKSTEPESKNSIMAMNLVLQFLFYELRNANKVRKWFYRKLSLELDELISKTTTGKLFDKLSIRDLDLGTQFPEIKNIRVHQADLHDTEGHIENIDLLLDLHYSGNFKLSIDADMVLGKKAFLSVKVKHMSGLVRLQFTRKPYTHWSLSFLGDPQIDLDIETQFQGRQMQSNVTSLISNQIRKAIRRKHTLPNYKLRYKPFFHKIDTDETLDYMDLQLDGRLDINIVELTRLQYPQGSGINTIYCTLTLASIPWILARKYDDKNIIITLDIKIHKAKNQQIGIVFKQIGDIILIESIIPNTPATKVGKFCKGDVIISIEGKKIDNINQIAKIVKHLNRSIIVLRIERIVNGRLLKSDNYYNTANNNNNNNNMINHQDDDIEFYEDFNDDFNISFTKNTESIQFGNVIKSSSLRKNSCDKNTPSSDSSHSNTPTNSPRKIISSPTVAPVSAASVTTIPASTTTATPTQSQQQNVVDKHSSTMSTTISSKLKSLKSSNLSRGNSDSKLITSDGISDNFIKSQLIDNSINEFIQHSTSDLKFTSFIKMDDNIEFKLNENLLYLNFNVFGKCNNNKYSDESIHLGYVNISVLSVLAECSESNLGSFIKQYTLIPPDIPNLSTHPLSNQSGFDSNLCFGDVLLTFGWSGNTTNISSTAIDEKKFKTSKLSMDKLDDDIKMEHQHHHNQQQNVSKQHVFIRKHFQRATQCDFCGKKIWLKDAVQCRDCSMCCHKKCINKCQNSTICGPIDTNTQTQSLLSITSTSSTTTAIPSQSMLSSVEFKLTEPIDCDQDQDDFEITDEAYHPKLDCHRQSFSELITQGLKRVNSANNLSIPGITSVINQGSRSLPPSPQHTPRKQSLVNQSTNPFVIINQKLELLPNDTAIYTTEQIVSVTEQLCGCGTFDELMGLAKSSSRSLYSELEPMERVTKINELLSKIRIALDSETQTHANLTLITTHPIEINKSTANSIQQISFDTAGGLLLQTKGPIITSPSSTTTTTPTTQTSTATSLSSPSSITPTITAAKLKNLQQQDIARKAFLVGQSEERIQLLSVIMLYLCTGLQNAQDFIHVRCNHVITFTISFTRQRGSDININSIEYIQKHILIYFLCRIFK